MDRESLQTDFERIASRLFERSRDPRILAAYVYGSAIGPRHRPDSDLDIAVLDRSEDPLGWESQCILMDRLERAVGWPVDLRLLREGSLSFRHHVLTDGRPLWVHDEDAVRNLMADVDRAIQSDRPQREADWAKTLRVLAERGAP